MNSFLSLRVSVFVTDHTKPVYRYQNIRYKGNMFNPCFVDAHQNETTNGYIDLTSTSAVPSDPRVIIENPASRRRRASVSTPLNLNLGKITNPSAIGAPVNITAKV